jgi:hypothetical protein
VVELAVDFLEQHLHHLQVLKVFLVDPGEVVVHMDLLLKVLGALEIRHQHHHHKEILVEMEFI